MERGDWQVTVHGVTKSQTQLSDTHTHTHTHMSIESMMPSNHLIPFFCPQSFPVSGSFPMSQLFASGGQSIASASASVLPMHIQIQETVCAERQKS